MLALASYYVAVIRRARRPKGVLNFIFAALGFALLFPFYACAMAVHLFIGALCFITKQPPPGYRNIDDDTVA